MNHELEIRIAEVWSSDAIIKYFPLFMPCILDINNFATHLNNCTEYLLGVRKKIWKRHDPIWTKYRIHIAIESFTCLHLINKYPDLLQKKINSCERYYCETNSYVIKQDGAMIFLYDANNFQVSCYDFVDIADLFQKEDTVVKKTIDDCFSCSLFFQSKINKKILKDFARFFFELVSCRLLPFDLTQIVGKYIPIFDFF